MYTIIMIKWEENKEALVDLIQIQKLPYEQIGRMFGCSGSNIKKIAKNFGITLVPRRKINKNETFNRGKGKTVICLNCGITYKPHRQSYGKFCSNKCQQQYYHNEYIKRWKAGEETGMCGEYEISGHIRRYILNKYNNSCQICGWNAVNQFTGKVPLEIHHIDGNYRNNSEDNLQLLCPNHHALTEFYKNNNKNGRNGRKKYY